MLHKGGHRAAEGTYWDVRNGQRVNMEQAGVLPGDENTTYIKASGLTVLLAGPVLGLIFAMFLPLIGIVMTATMVGKKIVNSVAGRTVESASFGWNPVEAYLAGRKKRQAKKEARKQKK